MKKGIHPKYKEITITCGGCGTVVKTRSTRDSYKVDVCSNCHPFYTGRQKYVDSAGRVERFQRKWSAAKAKREEAEKRAKKGGEAASPQAPAASADKAPAGNAAGTKSSASGATPAATEPASDSGTVA